MWGGFARYRVSFLCRFPVTTETVRFLLTQGPRALTGCALALLLVATLVPRAGAAPKRVLPCLCFVEIKDTFQRRNWTPQAMLYLKGTQGRRFISEDRNEGDLYDTVRIVTRSQSAEQRDVSRAAALLLHFLQQAQDDAEENAEQVYLQDVPVWKRDYFR
ncbi:spexin isoform X3 [Arapaima gigas]